MTPVLPSPPPRRSLSLPTVYAPLAKFPSTHKVPDQLTSASARGTAKGQRPLQPGAYGEQAWRGCAAATSLFVQDQALPGPITMDKPALIVWGEQGEIP